MLIIFLSFSGMSAAFGILSKISTLPSFRWNRHVLHQTPQLRIIWGWAQRATVHCRYRDSSPQFRYTRRKRIQSPAGPRFVDYGNLTHVDLQRRAASEDYRRNLFRSCVRSLCHLHYSCVCHPILWLDERAVLSFTTLSKRKVFFWFWSTKNILQNILALTYELALRETYCPAWQSNSFTLCRAPHWCAQRCISERKYRENTWEKLFLSLCFLSAQVSFQFFLVSSTKRELWFAHCPRYENSRHHNISHLGFTYSLTVTPYVWLSRKPDILAPIIIPNFERMISSELSQNMSITSSSIFIVTNTFSQLWTPSTNALFEFSSFILWLWNGYNWQITPQDIRKAYTGLEHPKSFTILNRRRQSFNSHAPPKGISNASYGTNCLQCDESETLPSVAMLDLPLKSYLIVTVPLYELSHILCHRWQQNLVMLDHGNMILCCALLTEFSSRTDFHCSLLSIAPVLIGTSILMRHHLKFLQVVPACYQKKIQEILVFVQSELFLAPTKAPRCSKINERSPAFWDKRIL